MVLNATCAVGLTGGNSRFFLVIAPRDFIGLWMLLPAQFPPESLLHCSGSSLMVFLHVAECNDKEIASFSATANHKIASCITLGAGSSTIFASKLWGFDGWEAAMGWRIFSAWAPHATICLISCRVPLHLVKLSSYAP